MRKELNVSSIQEIRSGHKIGMITTKEWMIIDCRNAPFIINQLEGEIFVVFETDGDISIPEQVEVLLWPKPLQGVAPND
jgi:hypothetical protein